MSNPVLFRVDLALTKDKSPSDRAQVPAAGARVDFYGQGATVAVAVTVPVLTATTVNVYDSGDLKAGSTVQVGPGGPTLTVVLVSAPPSFPGQTQITVTNITGSSVALAVGIRLVLTSDRPTVYSDPLGTVGLGSFVTADGDGRVACYVNRRRYDYTVSGVIVFQATSNATMASGSVLSWTHTDNSTASNRFVLVGISWQGVVGDESIASVTYGGVTMSLVAQSSVTAVYKLANPPAGAQSIVVTFTGPSPPPSVAAVGGAVSFTGVDQNSSLGTAATASGASTTPSVNVTSTFAGGVVVDTMGASGTTTATVGVGQTQQWNQASGGTIGRGCGSIESSTGSTVAMSWTLGTSRPWGIIGVGLKPAVRLSIDAVGATTPVVAWLNTRDFAAGIQASIDALPTAGGTVYLQGGMYSVASTIVIPKGKAVRVIGDGPDATTLSCPIGLPNLDILRIKGSFSTIENLTIKGPGVAGTGRGVVVGLLSADGAEVMRYVSIIGCRIIDTAAECVYLLDHFDPGGVVDKTLSINGCYERTQFRNNYTGGVVRIGRICNTQLFLNCLICYFRGQAINAIAASGITCFRTTFEDRVDVPAGPLPPPQVDYPYLSFDGCDNVGVTNCWFEAHKEAVNDNDELWRFISVGPTLPCRDVTVDGCRFVRLKGAYPRILRVMNDSKNVSLINPTCDLTDPYGLDRYTPGEVDDHKDVFIAAPTSEVGNEVYISGGVLRAGGMGQSLAGLTYVSAKGLVIAAGGPRLTPPRITVADRDSVNSLGRDVKTGDVIYNTDVDGPQFRRGSAWVPFVGRIATADFFSSTGTGFLPLVSAGKAGVYRIAVYLEKIAAGAGQVQVNVRWTDDAAQRTATLTVDNAGANVYASDAFVAYLAANQNIEYQVVTNSFQTRARLRAEALS